MILTPHQQQVLDSIKDFMNSDESVFILCGYAGTGKTTMVKQIADFISQSRDVALMAPTGRAARVLKNKTGYDATTIHKAIYAKAGMKVKTGDVIGKVDTINGDTQLHFEVWQGTKPQNPTLWLR